MENHPDPLSLKNDPSKNQQFYDLEQAINITRNRQQRAFWTKCNQFFWPEETTPTS
ncbi:hypothetical protein OAA19_01125 [Rubripirellula sp.]|nr:hypothetical protein [Rubripirellula sp.]MDB4338689.1 hypothetical protein [Rubripirellula sp.]